MVSNQTIGPTFTFQAIDIPNPPPNYKLPNDLSKIAGLYSIICLKKDMLVEIYCKNHDIADDIVNRVDRLFKASTTYFNKKSIMCILFSNKIIGALTRIFFHYCTHEIEKRMDIT